MSAPLPYTFSRLPRWTRQQVALDRTVRTYLGAHVTQPAFAAALKKLAQVNLGVELAWTLPDVRPISRDKIHTLCAPEGYFAAVTLAPGRHQVLLDIDPSLAAWAVHRLLGGAKSDDRKFSLRAPSELELGVLSYFLLQLLAAFSRGLVGGQELAPRLHHLVGTQTAWLADAPDVDNYVGVGLKLQLGNRVGYLRLLLPEDLVTGYFGEQLGSTADSAQDLAHMRACLAALPEQQVELRVHGAELDLSAQELHDLEPGDIIVLENHRLKLATEGPVGEVQLRLGSGRHGHVDARLYDALGEARLEVLHIAQQETLEGVSMDEQQQPAQNQAAAAAEPQDNLPETTGLLREVDAPVAVELGRIRLNTAQLVRLRSGQVLRLPRGANDPVDLVVGGKLFARGELIEVDGELGVRLTQITGSR